MTLPWGLSGVVMIVKNALSSPGLETTLYILSILFIMVAGHAQVQEMVAASLDKTSRMPCFSLDCVHSALFTCMIIITTTTLKEIHGTRLI